MAIVLPSSGCLYTSSVSLNRFKKITLLFEISSSASLLFLQVETRENWNEVGRRIQSILRTQKKLDKEVEVNERIGKLLILQQRSEVWLITLYLELVGKASGS